MVNKKTLIIFFIAFLSTGLFFGLKGSILTDKFIDVFFTKYQEIDIKDSFIGNDNDPEGNEILGSPLTQVGVIVSSISPRSPRTIHFGFKKPIRFDSFSIFFYGDLHSVSSTSAKDFCVYYQDKKDQWQVMAEVRDNTSPVYQFRSPTTISTNAVEIVILRASFHGIVRYGDLKFFQKQRVGVGEKLKFFINSRRRGLLARWFYYFTFLGFLFLPGYIIMDLITKRKKWKIDSDSKIIFSPVFSIVFLSLIALIYLLTGRKAILNSYLFIFLCSLIWFVKNRKRLFKEIRNSITPLLLITTALLIIFLVIAERDYLFNLPYFYHYLDKLEPIPMAGYPGYEADNRFQWGIARMFLHRFSPWSTEATPFLLGGTPATVFDRTPVLSLMTTVILGIFGESHFIYQRFLEVLAVLYYGAAYLVIKSYFSKRIAKIVIVLILLNVHLTYYAFNAEVYFKYFAIYPMLLALILINKKGRFNNLITGLLIGISFFIHPMVLIFAAVVFFVYLKKYKISRKFFEKSFISFFSTFVFFLGWALFSRYIKQKANLDLLESQNLYLKKLLSFRPQFLFNKLINIVNIFIPDVLLKSFHGSIGKADFFNYFIKFFLRLSLMAALSPIFIIVLILSLINKKFKNNWLFLYFGIGPLIIFVLILHDYSFGGYVLFYPFIMPFLLTLIVSRLVCMNIKKRLLIMVSYLLFMLLSLYYFSGVFVSINCASLVVHRLFLMILVIYFALSTLLLKSCFFDFKKDKHDK